MASYGSKELAAAHRTVRRNTLTVAREIPEEQYDFVPAPGTKSVRQLLAHIAFIPRLQDDFHRVKHVTTLKGYDFPGFLGQVAELENQPRTKDELIALLEKEGETYATWLESLSPEFLNETYTDHMGENPRTRFEGVMSAKEHEMHHRGQLMLIERMLGITPHLTRERQARSRPQPAAT
jgi:uncharacterized damage-inducible protein DinB